MPLRERYAGPILSIRWIRVTVTVAVFAQVLLSYLWAGLVRRRSPQALIRAHDRNGERLFRAFTRLRGVYIKVGQFLSTQVVVLPPPILQAMARMQDRVPEAHTDAIERRLVEAFGDVDAVFSHFDRRPLATASIGQVHRATLRDGRDVVVKVRYPGVTRFFMSDLRVIEVLFPIFVAILERVFEGGRSGIDHRALIGELVTYLRNELNYVQERINHERMLEVTDDLNDDNLVVPRLVPELCGSAVLVMDYVEGENLATWFLRDDVDHEAKEKLYASLFRASAHGVLRHGFFQADPHPGNFMATPDGRLVMIDFGCAQQLPEQFHHGILDVIGGFMGDDTHKAARALWDLGFRTRAHTVESLEAWVSWGFAVIREVLEHFRNGDSFVRHLQDNVARYSGEVLRLADEHRLASVPETYVMLGRALVTPPVPYNRFQPRLDMMAIIMPYVFELSTRARSEGHSGATTD